MAEDEKLDLIRKISTDLDELKLYLRFLSVEAISTALNAIATTPERQQMWRLADGLTSNEEISKLVGVSLRGVQYFFQDTEKIGLTVFLKRGYPKRVLDVFPSSWKEGKIKRTKNKSRSNQKETEKTEVR